MNDSVQLLPTPSKTAALSVYNYILKRYKDLLNDCIKQYKKSKENVKRKMNNLELMRGHKLPNEGDDSTDYLLKERSSLRNANYVADNTIEEAMNTRNELMNQRNTISHSTGMLSGLLDRFPVINSLVGQIKRKRAKDKYF